MESERDSCLLIAELPIAHLMSSVIKFSAHPDFESIT